MLKYDANTYEMIRTIVSSRTTGHGGGSFMKPVLVEKMLDQIPDSKGKWAVFYNIELLFGAIAYKKVSPKNITFFEDCPVKQKIAQGWGCNTASISVLLNKDTIDQYMKKFDVSIGNPPYNKGILDASIFTKNTSGYPHLAFSNIAQHISKNDSIISLLMPASFMTLGSCNEWRKHMMSKGHIEQLMLLDNRKNQVFNIEHTWICNMIYKPGNAYAPTEYCVVNGANITKFTVDLKQYTYQDGIDTVTTWPMFFDTTVKSIYEKLRAKALPMKREVGNLKKSNHAYIGYVLQGVKDRPVVNNTPKDRGGKKDVKAPGYILFDNNQQAHNYCDFMNSDLYALMIMVTKCISKTQPQSIVQIGNFDFSNVNTKDENSIYQFFGLTTAEVERVKSR